MLMQQPATSFRTQRKLEESFCRLISSFQIIYCTTQLEVDLALSLNTGDMVQYNGSIYYKYIVSIFHTS
jgi:hypothetical protein